MKRIAPVKSYIGDSVYAHVNEFGQIVLTTENGISTDPSNTIYLEPEIARGLVEYIEAVFHRWSGIPSLEESGSFK